MIGPIQHAIVCERLGQEVEGRCVRIVRPELDEFRRRTGTSVSFSKEACELFLAFARSPEARWPGNFRDLNDRVHESPVTTTPIDFARNLGRYGLDFSDLSHRLRTGPGGAAGLD